QVAAVIGREFTLRVLERVAERGDGALPALDELRGLELIYEKASYPELAYMFKHALTHDVAYQSLLVPDRRELHRKLARLMAALGDFVMRRGEVEGANAAYAEAIAATQDPERRRWLRNKVVERRFFERDGVHLAYYVHGAGSGGDPKSVVPVVLLHPLVQGFF